MKSKHLLLTLLLALLVPWTAMAQETVTVCDGTVPGTTTTTNCYVPVNSYYTDTQGATSEFIIPSTTVGMDELAGGTISKLTFYIPNPPASWGTPTIQVYMGEVEGTTLSSLYGPTNTNVTIVSESVWDNTQTTIEVNLTTPYTYEGGNLLVGTYVKTKSGYKGTYFYGITAPSGSSRYNNGSGSGTVQEFLPKTTFTYEPASTGDCEKPETFTASQITPNTAMLTWEGGSTPGNGYNVEIKGGQYADWTNYVANTTSQSCELTGLIENTAYQVRVQTVCSEPGAPALNASGWKSTNFSTPAYFSNFAVAIVPGEGNKAVFSWTENGFTPTEWQLCINGDENNLITMTTNPFTYDGLTPEVSTTAKMRAYVGESNTGAWSNPVTFTPTDAFIVTVYADGTENETSSVIPMYGNYFDDYTKSECIIPATLLGAMQWGQITSITFYAKTVGTSNPTWANTNQKVFVKEVNSTTLGGSYSGMDGATIVFDGLLPMPTTSADGYTITFSQPYTYNGGNLLIGVYNDDDGSFNNVTWYGKTGLTSGVSAYGSNTSSLAGVGYTEQTFLPKTTFNYTPGEEPDCFPVSGLAYNDVDDQSAKLSWTASESEETAWKLQYRISGATEWTTVSVLAENLVNGAYPLTGLAENTTYNWQVAAWCNTDDDEAISTYTTGSSFTTTCTPVANLPLVTFDDMTGTTSGSTNNLPDCWNYINTNTNSYYTGYPLVYEDSGSSYSGDNHLRFYTYSSADEYAILPIMESLEGMRITFYARYYNNKTNLIVGVMSNPNDASTFVAKKTINDLTYTYKKYKVDFSDLEANQKYIALKMSTSYSNSYYIYVDDIKVAATPTCFEPENFALVYNSNTAHSASFNWTDGAEGQTAWQIVYSTVSDFNPDEATPVDVTHTNNTLTGLTHNTTYYAYVRANCGNNDYSDWSNKVSFSTLNATVAPSGLGVVSGTLAFNAATIRWNAVSGNDHHESYELYYSTNGTMPEELVEESLITGITETTCPLSGLTEQTTYYVWVRDNCGNDGNSPWTSFSFNTPEACPAPVLYDPFNPTPHGVSLYWSGNYDSYDVMYRSPAYTLGLSEPFNSASRPTGWTTYKGLVDDVVAGTAELVENTATNYANWRMTTYALGSYNATCNVYGDDLNNWLITKEITIAEGYSFSFDLAQTAYNNSNAPSGERTDERFVVLVYADNEWTILREWNNETGSTYVYNDITNEKLTVSDISLSAYVGKTVKIAFYGESTETNGDNDLHIDNVFIGQAVPATEWAVAQSGITTNSVILNDPTKFASETTYEVKVLATCNNLNSPVEVESNVKSFTTDIPCPAPSGVFALEVLSGSAKLYWAADAEEWELQVNNDQPFTITLADVTIPTQGDFEGSAIYILNVSPETEYSVKLRANCGATVPGDGYSEWTEPLEFTTPPACPTPTGLEAANLTQNTADLSWTGSSDVIEGDGYTVEYCILTLSDETETNTETFAGYTATSYSVAGELPDGWKGYSSGSYKPHVSNNSALGASYDITGIGGGEGGTDNFLYMIGNSTSPNNSFTILPQYGGLVSVSFDYAYESTTNGTLSVGYCTDNTSGATFTAFDDLTITKTTDSENVSLTEDDIAAINSNNGYLAFRWNCSNSYGIAIDNVAITSHTYTAGEWQTATTGYKTGYTYQLTGLTAGTKYNARVYAGCTTDVENENATTSFTTLAEGTKVFVTAGDWSTASNWVPAGAPSITDNAILRANATINDGTVAAAKKITMEPSTTTLTIADGGQLQTDNTVTATVMKNITGYTGTKDHYYLIANPLSSTISTNSWNSPNTTSVGLVTTESDYDLYQFNYAIDLEWRNYEATAFNLYNGLGYLYANANDVVLTFTGTVKANNGTEEKTPSYLANNDEYEFNGWNLYGNPFVCNAYLVDAQENGAALPYYKMNDNGDGLTATAGNYGAIAPMQGIFIKVENTDKVYFTRTAPATMSTGPMGNLNIVATCPNTRGSNVVDNAIVSFGNSNTLEKLNLFASDARVFIPQDSKDYAVAYAESNVGEIPVSFKAEKNGSFTLSFTAEEVSFSYLHLIDNLTGTETDLLENPSYSFDARTTDYASRFKLVFATGNNGTEDNFAFFSNGNFVINNDGEATLQVVDVMGRIIKSESINGCANVNVNAAPGVYMLRLINGDNMKVQKVVVR